MRILIKTFGMLLCAVLCTLLCWNVYQADAVRENVERSLERSLEQVVQEVRVKEMYEYSSKEQMQADFIKALSETDTTSGIVSVKFYGNDNNQGLLNVTVQKTFYYPTGKIGKVQLTRQVLTEEYTK